MIQDDQFSTFIDSLGIRELAKLDREKGFNLAGWLCKGTKA
jgi:hypothetical protein